MVNIKDLKILADKRFLDLKTCYEAMNKKGHRAMTWGYEEDKNLMRMIIQRVRKNGLYRNGLTIKIHKSDNAHWLEIHW